MMAIVEEKYSCQQSFCMAYTMGVMAQVWKTIGIGCGMIHYVLVAFYGFLQMKQWKGRIGITSWTPTETKHPMASWGLIMKKKVVIIRLEKFGHPSILRKGISHRLSTGCFGWKIGFILPT